MGVQRDDVAVADQAQRTARSRLGADVQNTRAVGGSAHPGIGNPHHVGDALAQQLAGDGQLAPFGHAGGTARAGIAQHQHGIRGDIQVGVVEAGHHVAHVVEHHGGPLVHQQGRGGRAALDHCAAGRQVAAHHGQALRRLERGIDGGDAQLGQLVRGEVEDFGGRRQAVPELLVVLHDDQVRVAGQDEVGVLAPQVCSAVPLMICARCFDADVAQYRFGGHADSFGARCGLWLLVLGQLGSQGVTDGVSDLVDAVEDGAELFA